MKGLLAKQPWINEILSGRKTWELRGSATSIRGEIALIESGTGTVVGTCEVVDAVGPLTLAQLRGNTRKHRVPITMFGTQPPYKRTHAWVLRNARRLSQSVPYDHPQGAVIWVNLPSAVAQRVRLHVG